MLGVTTSMPDPHDTLAIFAEVSVALAGFSGIVIAFGRRPIGTLSKLEMRRLSNLFYLSGLGLIISLTGASLLHLNLSDLNILWRWGSAALFFLITPWLVLDMLKVYRLDESEKAQVNPIVLYSFNSLAVAMILLQLANWIFLSESWPFFLALALIIAGAFQQFILLVRMGIQDDATGGT
jgi:hypothetical protein